MVFNQVMKSCYFITVFKMFQPRSSIFFLTFAPSVAIMIYWIVIDNRPYKLHKSSSLILGKTEKQEL